MLPSERKKIRGSLTPHSPIPRAENKDRTETHFKDRTEKYFKRSFSPCPAKMLHCPIFRERHLSNLVLKPFIMEIPSDVSHHFYSSFLNLFYKSRYPHEKLQESFKSAKFVFLFFLNLELQ